jgi:hypothetical protein
MKLIRLATASGKYFAGPPPRELSFEQLKEWTKECNAVWEGFNGWAPDEKKFYRLSTIRVDEDSDKAITFYMENQIDVIIFHDGDVMIRCDDLGIHEPIRINKLLIGMLADIFEIHAKRIEGE